MRFLTRRPDENKQHVMEIGGALQAMEALARFPHDAKLHEFANMLLKNLANSASTSDATGLVASRTHP